MSDTDNVLERFARLPLPLQRAIESALLGVGPVAPGTTIDGVQRARLASLVSAAEAEIAAQTPAPASSTRVVARSASPSAPWFSADAPRSAPPPTPTSTLPADLDEAVAIAVDHARLAQRMGSPKAHVRTILRGYCVTLFERPDVRREFGTLAELEALADYRFHGGVKPRD